MLTFAIAHMFQLFNYCYVGNELIIQSANMANAIYNCNWELIHDNKVKMALTFMIQRCQKEQRLTAAGIADLDFISYIKVLRLAFSFYTLLNHLFENNTDAI
ncbi:7tm Odorant receptor [Popillia japonica]|uniref:7tm Odorant receptor n=1 Tax=Popillia japonica TaxID=7064 RepID=A0AAW1IYA6_POPJA